MTVSQPIDAYDIATLMVRMMTDLTLNHQLDFQAAYKRATGASLEDLFAVRDRWRQQRGPEFEERYRSAHSLIEQAWNAEGRSPDEVRILKDSIAYRQWKDASCQQ